MVSPLPTVRIHGKYLEPNAAGTPRQGTITFTPSPAPISFPDQNVIIQGTETATLDTNGEFELVLIATDTANQNPTGWVYMVTEKLAGERSNTYPILLPYTDTSINPIELADLTPTGSAPVYLPVVGPQGPPGVIQTVNGKTGISITLNSSDIGAIPTSAAGVAGGVATLDGSVHVPTSQLPDLSGTYINVIQRGAASGVALLDASSKLVASQYDWSATTPGSVANAGAVGTSTKPARSDHVHAGVDLTSTQTVAGVKTFSSSPSVPTPSASGDAANKSYTDGAQTYTGAKSWALATAGDLAQGITLTGDTNRRFQVLGDGTISWGPGNAAVDASLQRISANVLNAVDTAVRSTRNVSTSFSFGARVSGDTVNRWSITSAGVQSWGDGTAAADTTLSRAAAGVLGTDSQLLLTRASSTASGYRMLVTGDTNDRVNVRADGQISIGPGNAVADVVINRYASGSLGLINNTNLVVFQNSGASANVAMAALASGDTNNRFQITGAGTMNWGPGNAATDTTLQRFSAGVLALVESRMLTYRTSSTSPAWSCQVTGDGADRLSFRTDGRLSWGDGTNAADTNLYRVSADVLATDDAVALQTIGKGFGIKEATNGKIGVATLVAGTVTVNNTNVAANSRIFLTAQSLSGTAGILRVSAKVNGTSFTITSSSNTDTSTVNWVIFDAT